MSSQSHPLEPTDTDVEAMAVLMRLQLALRPNGSTADHRARGAITAAAGALLDGTDPREAIEEHYAHPERRL